MQAPSGVPMRLRLPWYVTAYKQPDGEIFLWDGERMVTICHRRQVREGVQLLERARAASINVVAVDQSLEQRRAVALGRRG